MKISKFKNIYNRTATSCALQEELNDIKNGKYKLLIKQCRLHTSKNEYEEYKRLKVSLPLVTFCGEFEGGRKLEHLKHYNNILVLDIDHIERRSVDDLKGVLCKDKFIYAAWLSPSGEGLKALVKIESNPDQHKSSFNSIRSYFQSNYDIELDKSGSDVTRLCFTSWDDSLFFNQNSVVYTEKEEISSSNSLKTFKTKSKQSSSLLKSAFATEGLNKPEHRKIVKLIIKYLERKNVSITSSFEEWFKVAIAIANAFSYDVGEKYYLRLCELDREKHNEAESIEMLKYCYNNRKLDFDSRITLGTLIHYAKSKGFISKMDEYILKENGAT